MRTAPTKNAADREENPTWFSWPEGLNSGENGLTGESENYYIRKDIAAKHGAFSGKIRVNESVAHVAILRNFARKGKR